MDIARDICTDSFYIVNTSMHRGNSCGTRVLLPHHLLNKPFVILWWCVLLCISLLSRVYIFLWFPSTVFSDRLSKQFGKCIWSIWHHFKSPLSLTNCNQFTRFADLARVECRWTGKYISGNFENSQQNWNYSIWYAFSVVFQKKKT